ncbi:hypothetical protein BCV70DRAFT_66316 [Testicularia cyperi]|uniref:Uncharacterized protein n=1 Tax=Testicularia cyperi TaxID=1882483 RepID=A0A317XGD6_9BASI|nr:hypothetical protein BCV70DRAFT_66316 [Testicularia cyperi]
MGPSRARKGRRAGPNGKRKKPSQSAGTELQWHSLALAHSMTRDEWRVLVVLFLAVAIIVLYFWAIRLLWVQSRSVKSAATSGSAKLSRAALHCAAVRASLHSCRERRDREREGE